METGSRSEEEAFCITVTQSVKPYQQQCKYVACREDRSLELGGQMGEC